MIFKLSESARSWHVVFWLRSVMLLLMKKMTIAHWKNSCRAQRDPLMDDWPRKMSKKCSGHYLWAKWAETKKWSQLPRVSMSINVSTVEQYFYHFLSFLLCLKISLFFPLSNPTSFPFPWQSWVAQKHVLLFFNSNSKKQSLNLSICQPHQTRVELKGKSSNLNKGRLELGSLLICHFKKS